jgi:hypothetical protein
MGKVYRDEVFLRIKIVFPGLVDDTNLLQLGGGFICDNPIELPQFE